MDTPNQNSRPTTFGSTGSSANPTATSAAKSTDQGGADYQSMRDDLNTLKDTVTKFITQATDDATRAARTASSTVATQVSGAASNAATSIAEKGSELAAAATEQAKTFASELETMGRKNPLGAMAVAMMAGVLIGLLGRGRS